jgi:hypothetical protein
VTAVNRIGLYALGAVGVLAAALAALFIVGGNQSGRDTTNDTAAAGVIAVAAVSDADSVEPACALSRECLRQHYQAMTWQHGPTTAMTALRQGSRLDPQLDSMCHDASHAIGEVAVLKLGSISNAFLAGGQDCGSGYYHGVIATVTASFDPDKLIEVLVSACREPDVSHFETWECFHGIGHGFVFAANGNIEIAVDNCVSIDNVSDSGACTSGALMQELVDHGSDDIYNADPYRQCRRLTDPTTLQTCYDMNAVIVSMQRSTDPERFAVCGTVPEDYRSGCYLGLGRAIFSGLPLQGERVEHVCDQAGSDEAVRWCVEGASSNTAAYYGDVDEALSHCPELRSDLEAVCRKTLETLRGSFTHDPTAPHQG